MDSELNDIEIIQRITNRDSKALETLYDRYSPVLYTLVKRIVTENNVAEEILTEVFVLIWQKSAKFDINGGNLYAWLINLTRNKALDFKRRETLQVTQEYNDEYEDNSILPVLSVHIPSNSLTKTLNSREKIYTAFNNLTEAQQYVLSLAYFDGLTESEIAKKLNIPLLTVKSKIRVALDSVKVNLAKEINND
ncbi:MAG: sigma-70 family RNA polymerase sigma factor [Ignavibacteriales bacterium]|nr:sigma-70 family RNA polymerase sigma factor [Ignavibacteriales bacterium]